MSASILANSFATLAATISVAIASVAGHASSAYDDNAVKRLTRAELAFNAWSAFDQADRNNDKSLSVDEYAALAVVAAEIAHLNGFVSIETGGKLQTISLPEGADALSYSERVRIDAVARHTFYAFAGADGKLDANEYVRLENAIFESADLNSNGALTKRELTEFAQRQTYFPIGA